MNVTGGPPCPKCGERKSQVKDSRSADSLTYTNRRRFCPCGHRFSTVEIHKDEYRSLTARVELLDRMKKELGQ